MRKKKQSLGFIILLLVFGLGIGYAAITTTLTITGATDFDSNSWNVYWDNVQFVDGNITISDPTIDQDGTTVSFSATFALPGDYYEFTVDAVNDGTIDAMIDTISKTVNNSTTFPPYVGYEVTYEDGQALAQNQLLAADSFERYKVRIEYRTDIDPDDLPASTASVTMSFGANYIQATNVVQPVTHNLFIANDDDTFYMGEQVPVGAMYYNSYQELVDNEYYPIFVKEVVSGGRVIESYSGYYLNNQVYYLRGGGATYDDSTGSYNNDSPYFATNKATLQTAFGIANCQEYNDGDAYGCTLSGISGFVHKDGFVNFFKNSNNCLVHQTGYSYCGIYMGG